jgi:integrase/recombinase XerD
LRITSPRASAGGSGCTRRAGNITRCRCTHTLEEYLDSYIRAAGIGEDKKGLLFRSALRRTGQLSERPLARANAFHMIQRRATAAGIATQIGCHTFRATGITIYLSNGGVPHESPRTTKLYDRTSDAVSLDEVERVVF